MRAGAGVAAGWRVPRRAGELRGLCAWRVWAAGARGAHSCAVCAAARALPLRQQRDQGGLALLTLIM